MSNIRHFTDSELEEIKNLFELALVEDRVAQDVTSRAIFNEADTMSAKLVAREGMVVAGEAALPVLLESYPNIQLNWQAEEGRKTEGGSTIATISGPTIELLSLERTMLNVLQRLCGVATLTQQYVDAVAGTKAVILDTRKTIPGWRALDKYAVRCGGGQNHRMHLADAMMIKDNHIAAYGNISQTIERVADTDVPVVVECDHLEQVKEVLAYPVDRILLDNMHPDVLRKVVELVGDKIPLEASGGGIVRHSTGDCRNRRTIYLCGKNNPWGNDG